MGKFEETNKSCGGPIENIIVFDLNPGGLVGNTKHTKKNTLLCTTEMSIVILINLNCKAWLVVFL